MVLQPRQVVGLNNVISTKTASGNDTQIKLVFFSDPAVGDLYSTVGQLVKIADVSVNPPQAGSYEVQFNASNSLVTGYTNPEITLGLPGITILTAAVPGPDVKKTCDQNCATDTECESRYVCSQGRCRLPADTADDKCGVKPDQGIHRGCNQYCADNNECLGEFTCYYNQCRNPATSRARVAPNQRPLPRRGREAFSG